MADTDIAPTRVCTKCGEAKEATSEFFAAENRCRAGLSAQCRDCVNVQTRERRANNPLETKAYYEANKAIILAKQSAYSKAKWKDNPEPLRERQRELRASNRSRYRAYGKVYDDKNRETLNAKHKARLESSDEYRTARNAQIEAWRKANRDKARVYVRNRRAAIKGVGGTHAKADIDALLSMQKGKCWWCSVKLVDYHVDHRIPIAKGGGNGPDNLVISCPTCNHRKSAKMPWEIENPRLL